MQQESNYQQPIAPRRIADQQQAQILSEILKGQQDILTELSRMNQRFEHVDEAFVLNDLNKPDFHGHRAAHIEMMRNAKVLDGYKQEATKKVLGVVAAFVLGLVATGFIEAIKAQIR